jgi:hypothetical protein
MLKQRQPSPLSHPSRSWRQSKTLRRFVTGLLSTGTLVSQCWFSPPAQGQMGGDFCQLDRQEINRKESLRRQAIEGNRDAQKDYQNLLEDHAQLLRDCRSRSWLKDQAIWIRLYPCDVRAGKLEETLDKLVNRGYNQVYVEVFYDGQVLLPASNNPTAWEPVVRTQGYEDVDLFAQAIEKGRERGLEVYAWLYSMNFGYTYAQRAEREHALARNGKGQSSLTISDNGSQVFIDPYNRQARSDYYGLVQEIAKRKPDGMLFDYIRYPKGNGSQSVISAVQDLWIYGDASRNALYLRAMNQKGRTLIERYLNRGYITAGDINELDTRYPNEGAALWQGRTPVPNEMDLSLSERQQRLQFDLWNLTVAHAAQGVLDFLAFATLPAQQAGIEAGAVFFPESNKPVGQTGFDSRLQPWDRFSSSLEWHPMSYGICGEYDTSCIVRQVQRVAGAAPSQTKVVPAIAGTWGRPMDNRPSLDRQMEAIRRANPQVRGISHFAFSWQEPEMDNERKFCRL